MERELDVVVPEALETFNEPAPVAPQSPAMRRLMETVRRVAPREITVLVRGETGVGKELIASMLHAESGRHHRPLVRFNCAAIPGELAEAELFGYARGAFTGAAQSHRGYFAQADGGTLVLDEVAELSLAVQAKLLRTLQEGEIQRVGTGQIEKVDVRVVACTNRDLRAQVSKGAFREDLYYRLAVLELVVPPLRERREDIPALAAEFARRAAERFGLPAVRLSPALLDSLQADDWPGNVRQLENTVLRLLALSSGGEIDVEDLPNEAATGQQRPPCTTLHEQVEALERSLVQQTLVEVSWNQTQAARRLGVSRGSLIDRMKKYRLQSTEENPPCRSTTM